jgi:periplasmic protein TonB
MGMDRTEQIGLGSAIGAHALLLILLSLGLFGASERLVRPPPIEVSIIAESAPEATSPKPSTQAPAPSEQANEEESAPITKPEPKPIEKVQPKAVVKPTPKPTPKTVKPAAKPAPTSKPIAKAAPKPIAKPAPKSGGFGKGFEDRIAGFGSASSTKSSSSGTSTRPAAPPSKTASQVRSSVTASLAAQIRPYLQSCAPSGVDIDAIRTFITLSLNRNGSLASVRFDKQTGVSASNSPQADPLQQCALKAARQASPYDGLDPEYYDIWKNHALQLKAK